NTTGGGMNSLQQIVERQAALDWYYQFAVEHKLRRLQLRQRRNHFRKITRQRLPRLRLQLDVLAVAKSQTAKAIPLRLILPLVAFRDFGNQQSFHRQKRRFDWQGHDASNVRYKKSES